MNESAETDAARNILVFHGVGGVGKTTLSKRLETWLNAELAVDDAWGAPPLPAVDATARIDLQRSQGRIDMVNALVTIRQAFGRVQERWTAFDIAFTAYWAATRPNEQLPGENTHDSAFADTATTTVREVAGALGIPGAGLATRVVRSVVKELRVWKDHRDAISLYDDFENLLTRCVELPTPEDPRPELLGELAALLDFEVSNRFPKTVPLVAVFIDAFERLTYDPRRTDERTINELVWSMPSVLFVVTGRHALDWFDDRRTNLHTVGPACWPGLAPGCETEPRQHLVGKLAMVDRMRILTAARDLYTLDLSEEFINELATASGGLPQYLDLALELAANRSRNGGPPLEVADIPGSLGDLVQRVLDDVPLDEQRALRAAALFPYFDAEIVASAAGVDDGAAQRAMARPMIDRTGSAEFPFSMHDEIRQAIRHSSHDIPNGWSGRDWFDAATRGLAAIRRRHDRLSESGNAAATLETLGLAIALVCDQEVHIGESTSKTYADWVSQAIVFGPSVVGLRSVLPAKSTTSMGRGIINFVLSKTRELPVDDRVELLTELFESNHPLRLPAGRHRGYVLRDASRWEDAIAAFNELIAVSDTAINRYQRVLTMCTARRFRQALDECHVLPPDRAESIRGAAALSHGEFDGWFEKQGVKVADLRTRRRHREAIESAGTLYRWRALVLGDVQLADIEKLETEAEDAVHATGRRDAFLAKLFVDPVSAGADEDRLSWFQDLDRSRNDGEIGYRGATAKMALALHRRSDDELKAVTEMINNRRQPRGRFWIPLECVLSSYGYSVSSPPTQWLDSYEVVSARWQRIFDRWLRRF